MKYELVNGYIITGKKGEKPFIGSIVVNDNKIEKIVKGVLDDKIKKIDCSGKYIMPGMINAHVHLPGSGKVSKKTTNKDKVEKMLSNPIVYKVMKMVCKSNAKKALKSGVTTFRTVGGVEYLDTYTRDVLKKSGPRIVASDYALTVKGGHMSGVVAKVCNSLEEFGFLIEDLSNHHVDLIKLMITGGVLDAKKKGEPGVLKMTPEQVKYCCDKAHSLNLKVAAHVESTEGVKVALENGVDTIEHGAFADDEVIKLFKEKKAKLVCTISPAICLVKIDHTITGLNEMAEYNSKVVNDGIIDCAKKCIKEGIEVGLGTDVGCPFITHYDMYRELCYAHKYLNMSALDCIYHATNVNSHILGIDKETGTIESGKCADLLILKDNPIEDLTTLKNIYRVVYNGKIIKNTKVRKYKEVEERLNSFLYE